MFYRVNQITQRGGLDPLKLPPLLTPGRMIRWRSSGAEYGLIEACVVSYAHLSLTVKDTDTQRNGEIYIEQVAEIALTETEAKQFNFGWPK
jgi:hypothetical protein